MSGRTPREAGNTGPVLAASGIGVSYGGVRAVSDVSVEVASGQLVGLIGPNGAGKTTFIDAISGFVASSGTVTLDGDDVSSAPPHVRARKGLTRTWQSIDLFDDLSIEKNLAVARHQPTARETLAEILRGPRRFGDIDEVLGLVGLEWAADAMPDSLSLGQRKLAGVARALIGRPRLLCLDEPAAGLDRSESIALGRRLRELVDGGQSMLLIDHDMGLVLRNCDHVVVLDFGEVIASGPPELVVRDPGVLTAYLGSSAALDVDELPTTDGRTVA